MSCPSHPPWLDHSNYTWRRVQVEIWLKYIICSTYSSTRFQIFSRNLCIKQMYVGCD
jgi:hypothetical protein